MAITPIIIIPQDSNKFKFKLTDWEKWDIATAINIKRIFPIIKFTETAGEEYEREEETVL